MTRPPSLLASAAFSLLVVAVGGGCNFGQNGIAPPTNRIFLPAGLVADPGGNFLYVVNSNSDLRFNAGTVVAVDLARLAEVPTSPPVCTKTRFSRTEGVPDDYCCRDMLDSNIVNCNEPPFIHDDATVQIGSFGGAVQLQSFVRSSDSVEIHRLFVVVRAEPSITYIDATPTVGPEGARLEMRCTGPHGANAPAQPNNAFCDDHWRVRRPGGVTAGALVLPEEPHVVAVDRSNQALFIGHLTVSANGQVQGGGVSALDLCNPEGDSADHDPVRFAGLSRKTFLPENLSQAVATLSPRTLAAATPQDPSATDTLLYATARYSTAISQMVFRATGSNACDASEARDLSLVPAEHFFSPAFLPNGADVRGILFSADGKRAYVLHRNDFDTLANPAGLAVLDRSPLADGTPSNRPIAVMQVCNGPTAMQMRDVGRGDRIFVTCYDDGQIYVIDPVALTVTGIIDAGAGPIGLVFSARDKGMAYVASFANSHLSVIDLRPGSPTENRVLLRIGLPHGYGE